MGGDDASVSSGLFPEGPNMNISDFRGSGQTKGMNYGRSDIFGLEKVIRVDVLARVTLNGRLHRGGGIAGIDAQNADVRGVDLHAQRVGDRLECMFGRGVGAHVFLGASPDARIDENDLAPTLRHEWQERLGEEVGRAHVDPVLMVKVGDGSGCDRSERDRTSAVNQKVHASMFGDKVIAQAVDLVVAAEVAWVGLGLLAGACELCA